MSKPPQSPPHSDIDGVHEDEERHIDTANRAGQDTGDLAKAKTHSTGRPPYSEEEPESNDRR